MSETLVLSADYQPVGRVTWQRAITLFYSNKVEIVDTYEDKEIRAATLVIKMPAVIRFLRALRSKRKAIKFSRMNVYIRDQSRCQYCRQHVPLEDTTYDHVLPRSRGGKTTWENVVIACMSCNQKKSNRTPEEAGMKLWTVPVRPKKLPDARIRLVYRKGMPEAWRSWLADAGDVIKTAQYWGVELDQD